MILAVTIFTIIANLYLGFAVFLRNQKSATNKLFLIYSLSVAFWALTNYLALVPGLSKEVSLLRIRLTLVAAATMTPLIYLLAHTFPENESNLKKSVKIIFWIFILGTIIVAINPITFYDVEFINGFPVPKAGPGIFIYGLNILGMPILAFIVLFKKYKKSIGRAKTQTRLFMYGILISYFFAEITNFIIVNLLQNSRFTIFGPFFTLILVVFIFYAITRYRFLDIKLIVLRSVTYISVFVLIALMFVLGFNIGIKYIFPNTIISNEVYWIILFMSSIITISVNPLYKITEKLIGKLFFKTTYYPEKIIFQIMQVMASEIDFDIIAQKVIKITKESIGISKMAILPIDQHKIIDIKESGFSNLVQNKKINSFEDVFHKKDLPEIILFDEIIDQDLKDMFWGTDVEIIIPVKIENKEVALILYGSKSSGDMYKTVDLDTLKIISKQLGESIENTNKFKILKLVDKIRSDFVDSVSHEFRTPLTESRWKLESLLGNDYGHKINKEVKKDITDIYISIRWLVESLNQLITASNFEVQEIPLAKQDVDVRDFIEHDVLNTLKDIIEIKNIKINTNIEESIPPINIDRSKIKQSLSIIIENALKYSKDKEKIFINASVRIGDDKSKFLHIEVKDKGIGIKKEDLMHMFSKFYRGEDARKFVPNGLGIGLFISKKFIELHQGKIWVESKFGEGSTFFIELPY